MAGAPGAYRGDLFAGLDVWREERFRKLQGLGGINLLADRFGKVNKTVEDSLDIIKKVLHKKGSARLVSGHF